MRCLSTRLLLLCTLLTGPAARAVQPLDLPAFEAYLDGVVATQFDAHRLAGMTLSLVYAGVPVFSKGYGYADLERQVPVEPARHLFRPGSVAKLITWTAVMQLVEQGRLDLDADVGTYVPQFAVPNAFNQPLTLKHLLTHTPGLEDGAAGFLFRDSPDDLVPLADSLAAHIPTQIWAPGIWAAYSNWGTALAGLVVANVSGQRFEDYVDSHIFAPLGMQRSTFVEPLPDALAPDMATGYVERDGALEPLGFEYIANFAPAGALSATAADMALFMQAHLNGGAIGAARILQPETVRRMHTRLHTHAAPLAGFAHGFMETARNGQRFVGHGGDTIAFHSQLLLEPQSGFGLFVSFNAVTGEEPRTRVTHAVLDYFFPGTPALPPFPATPLAGSAERIQAVVGAYRLNRRSYTRLEGLVALLSDLPVVAAGPGAINLPIPRFGGRFVEVAPYVFRQVGHQQLLVFDTDSGGRVTRAYIQDLPMMVADRVRLSERADVHLGILTLTLLAALFVIINSVRNSGRVLALTGGARLGQFALLWAAASFIVFVLLFAGVFAAADFNRLIFDFPPAGTALALAFGIAGALFTAACVVLLIPVWLAPTCSAWQRVRFTFVAALFSLFSAVLWYWNLLGWHY